ncbi:MAG: DUF5658 family protein [Gammaproteobacteria bacterium]|jgi:hypothetical protein|nr:DUF5658 family protein [Gammaproteobacteria bacterium]MDH3864131.1 DUF5658 family protein [Gammaproteobacteria bacterium]MDH3904327.1 DUF5658 family protein [Gammaproteobacteria bacterium]MDH3954178.1 DUF5658 family protein [Gammaproteobacteria bacterium]MDH4004684.1 DUF5658 family protein [Gammaproteobacteria bacterium]
MDDTFIESRDLAERRADDERRDFSWRTVFFGFMRSRRRDLRRNADAGVIFLDWHHPWLFFLAVGIMLLSCADAFLTLTLMQHGMIEANPFMDSMLSQGTAAFAVSKIVMTGTGILILVFLAKSRFMNRLRTGLFLTFFFSFYCCLVCYEIVNLLAVL